MDETRNGWIFAQVHITSVLSLRRVASVSSHGPRVVVVVTVAGALRVGHVGGRRPPARSHGHRQDGDLFG